MSLPHEVPDSLGACASVSGMTGVDGFGDDEWLVRKAEHQVGEGEAGQGSVIRRRAKLAAEGGFQLAGGHGPEVSGRQAQQAEAGRHHLGPGKGPGTLPPLPRPSP